MTALISQRMAHSRATIIGCLLGALLAPSTSFGAAQSAATADSGTLERARALFDTGKYVESEKLLREVLTTIDAGKMSPSELGRCLAPLADIYRAWSRNDEALKLSLRYRQFISERSALDPATRDRLLDQNASNLADLLVALDRTADAAKYLEASLATADKQIETNPLRALNLLVKLARLAETQDDDAKAKKYWDRVIELGSATVKRIERKQLPIAQYPDCVAALAAGYVATDRKPEAIRAFQQLLNVQTAQRDTAAAINTNLTLGSLYAEAGQHGQAVGMFQEAIAQARQRGADTPQEAELLSRLAAVESAQGLASQSRRHWDEAAAIYAKALARIERSLDAETQVITLLNQLQIVDQQAGKYQEAVA